MNIKSIYFKIILSLFTCLLLFSQNSLKGQISESLTVLLYGRTLEDYVSIKKLINYPKIINKNGQIYISVDFIFEFFNCNVQKQTVEEYYDFSLNKDVKIERYILKRGEYIVIVEENNNFADINGTSFFLKDCGAIEFIGEGYLHLETIAKGLGGSCQIDLQNNTVNIESLNAGNYLKDVKSNIQFDFLKDEDILAIEDKISIGKQLYYNSDIIDDLYYLEGYFLEKIKQPQKALKVYQQYLTLHHEGDHTGIVISRIENIESKITLAQSKFLLAEKLMQENNYFDAFENYRESISILPDFSEAKEKIRACGELCSAPYYDRSVDFERRGLLGNALYDLEKAYYYSPFNENLKEKINEFKKRFSAQAPVSLVIFDIEESSEPSAFGLGHKITELISRRLSFSGIENLSITAKEDVPLLSAAQDILSLDNLDHQAMSNIKKLMDIDFILLGRVASFDIKRDVVSETKKMEKVKIGEQQYIDTRNKEMGEYLGAMVGQKLGEASKYASQLTIWGSLLGGMMAQTVEKVPQYFYFSFPVLTLQQQASLGLSIKILGTETGREFDSFIVGKNYSEKDVFITGNEEIGVAPDPIELSTDEEMKERLADSAADEIVTKIRSKFYDTAKFYFQRAQTYQILGNIEEAVECYMKVKALYPNSELAERSLEMIKEIKKY